MKILGKHFIVSGRVQGVFFRRHTQKKAQQLKLTGWVRNLPDGSVEAKIFGDVIALQQMEQWLHQGPSHAKVTEVIINDIEVENFDDFEII